MKSEVIVGIDLGTTNSEVAAYLDGEVRILGPGPRPILPSCVGLASDGSLLVGEPARNQHRLYPDRTIRSIKRRMGSPDPVQLGPNAHRPEEISSLIIRELVAWAEGRLGQRVRRAVITVPAYFSDAQRNATREAGELAGLEVVRILNEPTAASLAYGFGHEAAQTALVYDLGGGTFDVSVVQVESDVTEVLATHGNNTLGGDDFDQLLVEHLVKVFKRQHGVDLSGEPTAMARLWWAAEEAKKRLSEEPAVMVREESLFRANGAPLHLEVEVTRLEYEEMIRPLLEGTLESVARALKDAGKKTEELDAALLGGSTRTPLVWQMLKERIGLAPRQDIDPDLCVALGAGVLASRLAGREVERILVDVSPYSFGPSYLGLLDGAPFAHCYHPVIQRNTPLPVTRTEMYQTSYDGQTRVRVNIFQGDHQNALKNVPVGELWVDGLQPVEGPNEVLCRMTLDLDGILQVTAIEKLTGLSRRVTIEGAGRKRSPEEVRRARERLEMMYGEDSEPDDELWDEAELRELSPAARTLLERAQRLAGSQHPDDAREASDLRQRIEQANRERDDQTLERALKELSDLLYYSETA